MIADPAMRTLSEELAEGFPVLPPEPSRGSAVAPVETDEIRDRELLSDLIFAQARQFVDAITRTPPDRQVDIRMLLNRFADATAEPSRRFRIRERERYLQRLHACAGILP